MRLTTFLWQVSVLFSTVFISSISLAEQMYIKPGMSKQIKTSEPIKTVLFHRPRLLTIKSSVIRLWCCMVKR